MVLITYKFASQAKRWSLATLASWNGHIVAGRSGTTNHYSVLGYCFIVGDLDVTFLCCVLPILNLQRLEDVEEWVLLRGAQIHHSRSITPLLFQI